MSLLEFLQPLDSSQKVLFAFLAIVLLAGFLYLIGVVGFLLWVGTSLVGALLRGSFACWRTLFSWMPWPVLLALIAVGQALAWVTGPAHSLLDVLLGAGLLFVGFTSVMAYMVLEQERYEVTRGYKALHSPGQGQELANLLVRYGSTVGLPLLLAACLASLTGFAILNAGLYNSVARNWYLVSEDSRYAKITDDQFLHTLEQREAGYTDFLAYALLNLAYAVDLVDMVNSSRLAHLAYVKPRFWAASVMLVAFRTFFTAIVVQQVFSWFRQMRLLQDNVKDFWNPNLSIHRRAGEALTHQGERAVGYMVRAMEQVEPLTQEYLEYLPKVITAIGPSAVPTLVQVLGHPREEVREVALHALGELRLIGVLPNLTDKASDPSERVRCALAEAVVGLFAPGVATVRKQWQLKRRLKDVGQRWWSLSRWRARKSRLPGDPVEVALPILLTLLRDEVSTVRLAAVRALASLGPDAAPATRPLAELVEVEDPVLLQELATTLGEIREPIDETVAALVHLLDAPSMEVKYKTLHALAKCGEDAAPAVPLLIPMLQDSDEEIRKAAAEVIGAVGELDARSIPRLAAGLKHRDNLLRARAAEAIGLIGPAAAATAPNLAEALSDANDRVREQAARALGKLGPEASVATDALITALGDEDYHIAGEAAQALGEIGTDAVSATPALLKTLRHVNAEVRGHSASALSKIEAPIEQLAPALVEMAQDTDSGVRLTALEALGDLARATEEVVAILSKALADESPNERLVAVRSLARLDVPHEKLAKLLAPLLSDTSPDVRAEAAQTMGKLDELDESIVTTLTELLEDPAEEVKLAATNALGQQGVRSAGAEERLREAFQQGSAAIREQVLRALASITPNANQELFLLALHDPIDDVRQLASAILLRMADSLTQEQIAEMVQALKDPDLQVRTNIAQVLSRLETIPPEAIPLLLDCASHPDDGLRLLALRAMRSVHTYGADVWPRMLQDTNSQVAFTAASYLLMGDPEHADAGMILIRSLEAETIRDRKQAMELLEELGARGSLFTERVRLLSSKEDDEELRERALRWLKAIRQPES